ncbi:MAG: SH3 domain-containing protein, partial [Thermoanaerobaculia bacterium]|nr:SH3 domain-containing protein [Thermoanaerobaculia bacterium]
MSSAFPSFLAASVLLAGAVHAAEPDLRIVSAAAVSLREAPGTSRATMSRLPLGTVVEERARTGGVDTVPWLLVATPSGEEGWLFGALTLPYAETEKDTLALEIADSRLNRKGDPFESYAELYAFLSRAAAVAGSPEGGGRLGLA